VFRLGSRADRSPSRFASPLRNPDKSVRQTPIEVSADYFAAIVDSKNLRENGIVEWDFNRRESAIREQEAVRHGVACGISADDVPARSLMSSSQVEIEPGTSTDEKTPPDNRNPCLPLASS
jgi:hypothetical protein